MAAVNKLREEIDVTKRELRNLRQDIHKQSAVMRSELSKVLSHFSVAAEEPEVFEKSKQISDDEKSTYCATPIGYISSCFKFKNGIPWQPSLCPSAKATLKIEKSVFTNPEHSLIGLDEFSHVWLLFIFHKNENVGVKAKVHPPRLDGASVGVFSTRSPHRPSPVGLSLTKLDKIEGDTLYLSGIDLLDGTPVIDIKPYIPMYDNPCQPGLVESANGSTEDSDLLCNQAANSDTNNLEKDVSSLNLTSEDKVQNCNAGDCKIPTFLQEPPEKLEVVFTNRALKDLEELKMSSNQDQSFQCMDFESEKIKTAITEVLRNDPRSIYRRKKCSDKLYYFYIDKVHVTSWFDGELVEVLKIKLSDST